MLSIFLYAFNAVASIALLSVFGYILQRTGVMDREFSGKLNKFIFRYGLSITLLYNVYNIESLGDLPIPQMLFCGGFVIFMFIFGLIVVPFITHDNRKRGVLTQAFFRPNSSVIGIPMAGLLGGLEAESAAAMFVTIGVILYNVLAVICFTVFDSENPDKKINPKELLIKISKNPLIRGISLGVLCLILRAILPKNANGDSVITLRYTFKPLYNAIASWAKVASPVLLVLLGARFDFRAVASLKKYISIGVIIRNVIAPILGYGSLYFLSSVLHLFEATPITYIGMISILAAPMAVTSTVMAAEMGGDETLAGQIVVWSTLFSVFSLFAVIVILRSIGLM